jgi:hypothetical protein
MRFASNALGLLPMAAMALLCVEAETSSRQVLAAADGGHAGRAGDALTPAKRPPDPSLSQTGTVGTVGLEGQAAAKTLRAKPRHESRPEKPVTVPHDATDAGTRTVSPPKEVLPPLLQQLVTARLRSLGRCRRDVARDKHVPAAQLAAGAMLLRWTIDATGTVSAPEVVEQTPVDPAIMDCVKRTIAGWTFSPPDKGRLSVERHYQFRQPQ